MAANNRLLHSTLRPLPPLPFPPAAAATLYEVFSIVGTYTFFAFMDFIPFFFWLSLTNKLCAMLWSVCACVCMRGSLCKLNDMGPAEATTMSLSMSVSDTRPHTTIPSTEPGPALSQPSQYIPLWL